jgi:CheY-like chemotaxis protein
VARVIAVFDDLLLGSNVQGSLRATGHDVTLTAQPQHVDPAGADLLVVDLGSAAIDGIGLVERLRAAGELGDVKTLGVYSHVEHDVRRRAEAAGFDMVVPRSRMAREGGELVARLTSPAAG